MSKFIPTRTFSKAPQGHRSSQHATIGTPPHDAVRKTKSGNSCCPKLLTFLEVTTGSQRNGCNQPKENHPDSCHMTSCWNLCAAKSRWIESAQQDLAGTCKKIAPQMWILDTSPIRIADIQPWEKAFEDNHNSSKAGLHFTQ